MPNTPDFVSIRRLAEYEAWCNARVLDTAVGLRQNQLFRRFPIGVGRVYATLFDTVQVFAAWSTQTRPRTTGPTFTDYDPKAGP